MHDIGELNYVSEVNTPSLCCSVLFVICDLSTIAHLTLNRYCLHVDVGSEHISGPLNV